MSFSDTSPALQIQDVALAELTEDILLDFFQCKKSVENKEEEEEEKSGGGGDLDNIAMVMYTAENENGHSIYIKGKNILMLFKNFSTGPAKLHCSPLGYTGSLLLGNGTVWTWSAQSKSCGKVSVVIRQMGGSLTGRHVIDLSAVGADFLALSSDGVVHEWNNYTPYLNNTTKLEDVAMNLPHILTRPIIPEPIELTPNFQNEIFLKKKLTQPEYKVGQFSWIYSGLTTTSNNCLTVKSNNNNNTTTTTNLQNSLQAKESTPLFTHPLKSENQMNYHHNFIMNTQNFNLHTKPAGSDIYESAQDGGRSNKSGDFDTEQQNQVHRSSANEQEEQKQQHVLPGAVFSNTTLSVEERNNESLRQGYTENDPQCITTLRSEAGIQYRGVLNHDQLKDSLSSGLDTIQSTMNHFTSASALEQSLEACRATEIARYYDQNEHSKAFLSIHRVFLTEGVTLFLHGDNGSFTYFQNNLSSYRSSSHSRWNSHLFGHYSLTCQQVEDLVSKLGNTLGGKPLPANPIVIARLRIPTEDHEKKMSYDDQSYNLRTELMSMASSTPPTYRIIVSPVSIVIGLLKHVPLINSIPLRRNIEQQLPLMIAAFNPSLYLEAFTNITHKMLSSPPSTQSFHPSSTTTELKQQETEQQEYKRGGRIGRPPRNDMMKLNVSGSVSASVSASASAAMTVRSNEKEEDEEEEEEEDEEEEEQGEEEEGEDEERAGRAPEMEKLQVEMMSRKNDDVHANHETFFPMENHMNTTTSLNESIVFSQTDNFTAATSAAATSAAAASAAAASAAAASAAAASAATATDDESSDHTTLKNSYAINTEEFMYKKNNFSEETALDVNSHKRHRRNSATFDGQNYITGFTADSDDSEGTWELLLDDEEKQHQKRKKVGGRKKKKNTLELTKLDMGVKNNLLKEKIDHDETNDYN